MFGLGSKKQTEVRPPEALPSEPWGEIYTMPEPHGGSSNQAASLTPKPSASNHKHRGWLIGLVIALLALGVLGTYFAFFRSTPPPAPQPTPQALEEPSAPTPPPVVPTPPSEEIPSSTPAERDRTRYRDVSTLQTALRLYYAEVGMYPITPLPIALGLEPTRILSSGGFGGTAQGTTYLEPVPQNPAPGGVDYLYESLDGVSYTISFHLEEGTGGLPAGDHQATPLGITLPGSQPPAPRPRTVTPPQATPDGDQDGLTDAEELLFGSDATLIDSDSDTYADGLEVSLGYDPARSDSARLFMNSNLFVSYRNPRFGYTVYFPAAWIAKPVDKAEASEVVFIGSEADEFIEVLVVDNPERLSAQAWYAKQVPGLTEAEVPTIRLGNYTWAQSPDGLNTYVATDRYLITLSYNLGTKTEISFPALYTAMVRSFTLPEDGSLGTPIVSEAAD